MRKFMVLPVAALLVLTVAAPASAGANVSNTSQSALSAEGTWGSEVDGIESYGQVSAWQDAKSPFTSVEYYNEIGTYVDCTPEDDTDKEYGFQGQYLYGYGDGTMTISRGEADAHVTGVMEISTATVDDCSSTFEETFEVGVAVSMDLVATGPRQTEKGTSSFHVPSEYNSHSSFSTTFRPAAGSATIGGDVFAVHGGIGKLTWRDHGNG